MAEFQLEAKRPADLPKSSFTPVSGLPPVPQDEWDTGGSTPRPVQDLGKGKGQSSKLQDVGDKFMDGKSFESGSFKTPPSSWQQHSEGRMPSMERGYGTRTEGPQPEERNIQEKMEVNPGMERALEEEMLLQLWKENKALKDELEACKRRDQGETSSWSAVSSAEQVRTPRMRTVGSLRYTPGGTQVPPFTPPREEEQIKPLPPPIPPFPQILDGERYEVTAATRLSDRSMALGAQSWAPSFRGWGEKGEWTEWQLKEAAKEINRRAVRPDESWRNDKEMGELKPPVPPPVGNQWNRVFCPGTAVDSSAVLGEVCHHGRALGASSAVHGEVCHHDRAFGASAAHGEVWHQDRALGTSAVLGEVCHHGRAFGASSADLGDACGRDRAFEQQVSYRDDPLRHQQLPCRGQGDPMEKNGTGLVRGRERSPHDALRSNNPVLPRLPQYGTKTSSVDAADWIIEIQPIIGDMSNKATKWWTLTMQSTMKTYEKWLCATPLERLRLPPPDSVDPMVVGGDPTAVQRLEQRITTLLLPAVPEGLRQDLVANRELWPSAIIYKVLRTYQPGGWSERSSLLAELTQVPVAKDPMQAANGLRLWKRQRARAIELGAGLPDLMLQVRALDSVVSKILPQHPQALFRVSAFRMETHIDERPTTESLLQFHELLQAEVDTLVHSTPGSGGTDKPSTKALQTFPANDRVAKDGITTPPNANADRVKLCRFWGTPDGCKHAKQCKFGHAALPDARERCWLCSAKDHRKNECPYGKDAAGPQAGGSGKSTGKGDGGATSSMTSSQGKGGKGKYGNGGKNQSQSSTTSDRKEVESETDPKVAAVGTTNDNAGGAKAGTGGSGESSSGETTKKESELMTEVTSLLRSLRASVKMRSIKRLSSDEEEVVLLDGGATHCLRTCESEKEWNSAKDIKVSLAEGETMMKQLPGAKTLLTRERVQPIVPVSMVTLLGYKISWSSEGCGIHHPEKGSLPVTLVQGCPTVPSKVGRQLMKEIEEWNQQQCQVRSILAGEERGHSLLHQRLEDLRNLFPGAGEVGLARVSCPIE